MSRSKKVIRKRLLPADPVYNSRLVTRFINQVMKHGKKSIAQRLIYQTLDIIKKQGQDPLKMFEEVIQKVGPRMEVRPRRIGGASYQVPVEVRGDRRIALSIHWLIEAARKRSNKEFHTFAEKLAAEITDAAADQGGAIQKRNTTYKMAESNKAFAHFRW